MEEALASNDTGRALALALTRDQRRVFQSAEQETHLITACSGGWRFFHDRAFAFLVADRIARRAAEEPGADSDHFGMLGPHLADPLWTDVIEATGRLLELAPPATRRPATPDPAGSGAAGTGPAAEGAEGAEGATAPG